MAAPTAALRKQVVASDDQGHARVLASLSSDSHHDVSNALRAYDRLVLKESHNIHVNQKKILEAQHPIKKSQLNIERAQKSLVDDIRAIVKSSNTDEVRASTSPRDICAATCRGESSHLLF
jgi:hypothetical protein